MENKGPPDVNEEFDPQLIDAVKKQIEYYFSKENLQSDAYLTSQMDAQMSVPISVVMKFAKLKALTQEESVVRRALVDSTAVAILDNRIKATIKSSGRSTIILREIPSDAPIQEVREIFNYDGCKQILSLRSDIGDTWFVVMETEEDAKDTALDLRLKKRTFKGQPVKARIKTEPAVRSFYPVASPASTIPPVYPPLHLPFPPVVPSQIIDLTNYGYLPAPPAIESTVSPIDEDITEVLVAMTEPLETREALEDSEKTLQEDGSRTSSRPKDVRKLIKSTKELDNRRKLEPRKLGTPNHSSKEVKEKKVEPPIGKPPIEVNAMTFPPLLGMEDTPIPTPGYKDVYQKYNFDAIINIVKSVKDAVLPPNLNPADHIVAMTATPNMDLLKRQRTFSIDETREQLRQGRPVQREAIISGAVDYRSLMFGDDQDPNHVKTKGKGGDALSASQLEFTATEQSDLSKALEESCAISINEVKQKNEITEVLPQSPQRISASTWAAMVKSSALVNEATQNTFRSPSNSKPASETKTRKPIKEAEIERSDKVSTATTLLPTRFQKTVDKDTNQEKERKSHGSRAERRKNKDSEKRSADRKESKLDVDGSDSAAISTQSERSSNGAGAWGKTTFANVLKQTLSEDAVEEGNNILKRATINPTISTTNGTHPHSSQASVNSQKPLKLNSRGNGLKESGGSSNTGAGSDPPHRTARHQRDGDQHNQTHFKRNAEEKDRKEKIEESK